MGNRQTPQSWRLIVTYTPNFSSINTTYLTHHSGNMIGHPKHVHKACQAGADIIIAQGGEAGGHTGDIATSILIPACADICKQYKSPLTKQAVTLVAAGGVNDGRSVASALMLGASGVWVGTRFIPSVESKAPKSFKEE
jgi:NAD(P)H-dependent flavin oxidoreductase YrpB (nitropropane dioxygenase family)